MERQIFTTPFLIEKMLNLYQKEKNNSFVKKEPDLTTCRTS